jgi:FHA domain
MAVRLGPLRPRPLPPRHRARRAGALVTAGSWLFLTVCTGSLLAGTVLLLLLAMVAAAALLGMRLMGFDSGHPFMQRLASRPWRDGYDVLRLAMRHLPETFVITPLGAALAPDVVEIHMNPDDLASLGEVMDLPLAGALATEAYLAQVDSRSARLSESGRPEVALVCDPSIARGRYRLRSFSTNQPPQPAAIVPASELPHTLVDPGVAATVSADPQTVHQARSAPPLRLVTEGSSVETRVPEARAGRGCHADLRLPHVLTVSRIHAHFTFKDGHWWIANRGTNGLVLNGTPLIGQRTVAHGDSIQWGSHPGALRSTVELH